MYYAGDYRSAKEVFRQGAERHEREGDIGFAVSAWANVAVWCYALGELAEADGALARCEALAPRLTPTSVLSALAARATGGLVRGEFENVLAEFGTRAAQPQQDQRWAAGPLRAAGAALMAINGHAGAAISVLATAIPALERAEGTFANYTAMACRAAAISAAHNDAYFDCHAHTDSDRYCHSDAHTNPNSNSDANAESNTHRWRTYVDTHDGAGLGRRELRWPGDVTGRGH